MHKQTLHKRIYIDFKFKISIWALIISKIRPYFQLDYNSKSQYLLVNKNNFGFFKLLPLEFSLHSNTYNAQTIYSHSNYWFNLQPWRYIRAIRLNHKNYYIKLIRFKGTVYRINTKRSSFFKVNWIVQTGKTRVEAIVALRLES